MPVQRKKVFGYFNRNNYEYINNLKSKLNKDGMNATKSKILELGVLTLRKKKYGEIKEEMGELI